MDLERLWSKVSTLRSRRRVEDDRASQAKPDNRSLQDQLNRKVHVHE